MLALLPHVRDKERTHFWRTLEEAVVKQLRHLVDMRVDQLEVVEDPVGPGFRHGS